ncbi:ABC transporter permease [Flaviflexus equikiangi]|uniref:ABC transporter permease n=1 Tax=Flaviflexus equikiangi TaxID=2758573 RepID=A0ABS2TGB7_9ACTO|nr:ABC transporter permease [Flaviflexus equikiangi]MBM9432581.1 ABC transporter permease [Flaviflexus equikiangi]
MQSVYLVARREFQAQLRSKSLIVSTIVMAILIIAAGVLGKVLLERDAETEVVAATVGVTDSAMPLADTLEESGLVVVEATGTPEDILAGDESLDALITAEPGNPIIFALDGAENLDLITTITQTAATDYVITEQFGDEATSEALEAISQAQNLAATIIGSSDFDPVQFFVALLTVSLVYGMIVFGISILATGVVEEKTSRVVEILLATIRPRTLLMGKFLGIGLAILSMVAVYVAAIVIAATIAGLLPDVNIATYIPMLLVWVLLGYIIYASITGGLAATVSRQEDIGAITGPMVFLSIVPFYFAMFYVPDNPDSTLTQIVGFVPFFSPFVMPVRAAFTDLPATDLIIAIGLCLVTIPLLAALAGKIYERSILHTGTRMKIMEALRSA